jgi:hypothetical protein
LGDVGGFVLISVARGDDGDFVAEVEVRMSWLGGLFRELAGPLLSHAHQSPDHALFGETPAWECDTNRAWSGQKHFRFGPYRTLDGTDLIAWIKAETQVQLNLRLDTP